MNHTLSLAFIILTASTSEAQTFRAAGILGFNASQIDGDLVAGFDKVGLLGGLRVDSDLSERFDWAIELMYSQRGSRSPGRIGDPWTLSIDYVEIPLILSLKDWFKDDFYKVRFEGGLSVGRLIFAKAKEVGGQPFVEGLNQTDIALTGGAVFFSSARLAFSMRYTHSINLLRNTQEMPFRSRLRGYFLSFKTHLYL